MRSSVTERMYHTYMTRFISKNNIGFGCRVAAVICHNGHILLQGEPEVDFWTLPGGGIELLETSEAALSREMWEELSIHIRIERLLWIVEHFFANDQRRHHEIALFYLVEPINAPHLLEHTTFHANEGSVPILFKWFQIEHLPLLYPTFLQESLRSFPLIPQHVVMQSFQGPLS